MTGHRGLWAGLVVGVPVMAAGVLGAADAPRDTRPAQVIAWAVGLAVALDLVVLPIALGAGRLLRGRPWWRWAASTVAVVVVVAWPFARGYGRISTNPSLLPRDYATGTAIAAGAVLAVALVGSRVTRRREGP